ncbi:2,4-dienoyl-CoA reductase [Desulfomicrobium norvegicum]|uniref:2,4-dienoyl-CoA reductase n=1 Tax=Desulfomicrobium norvegicum (strain DSM 1741 / NCIMB 8310) TaxID=52561 RepID=A0A8G2C5R6_DESNO|nr:NADH:flavin oxidoreductase/NADH oxidase [Desulfomicrobium norvegicum]SFM14542.1 2,4-dienoyl-CoA reductase [Desulfomicrobium norvegicum]
MSALFSPISLGNLSLQNRIVIAPMCQYSAQDGLPTDWHLIHLGQLAVSGAGLLIIEATAVEPAGRISPQDLGLWSDETEAALTALRRTLRNHSSMPVAIQLAHAGRKGATARPWDGGASVSFGRGGWTTSSASALPFEPEDAPPVEMDANGIARVVKAFRRAAERAQNCGFDCVELHCAHGYLMHQFLSPLSNQRQDEYGGSLENRMRLPLMVFREIRAVLPQGFPLGVRISATDWIEGGWDLEQSTVFAARLKELGCDYIHVSSGGLSPLQKIKPGPGYQVPFAAHIKRETGMTTIAVGLITQPRQAEEIITSGQADLTALGRGMLYDPRWPWHAAAELGACVDAPSQYLRCEPHGVKDLFRKN